MVVTRYVVVQNELLEILIAVSHHQRHASRAREEFEDVSGEKCAEHHRADLLLHLHNTILTTKDEDHKPLLHEPIDFHHAQHLIQENNQRVQTPSPGEIPLGALELAHIHIKTNDHAQDTENQKEDQGENSSITSCTNMSDVSGKVGAKHLWSHEVEALKATRPREFRKDLPEQPLHRGPSAKRVLPTTVSPTKGQKDLAPETRKHDQLERGDNHTAFDGDMVVTVREMHEGPKVIQDHVEKHDVAVRWSHHPRIVAEKLDIRNRKRIRVHAQTEKGPKREYPPGASPKIHNLIRQAPVYRDLHSRKQMGSLTVGAPHFLWIDMRLQRRGFDACLSLLLLTSIVQQQLLKILLRVTEHQRDSLGVREELKYFPGKQRVENLLANGLLTLKDAIFTRKRKMNEALDQEPRQIHNAQRLVQEAHKDDGSPPTSRGSCTLSCELKLAHKEVETEDADHNTGQEETQQDTTQPAISGLPISYGHHEGPDEDLRCDKVE
mmetsp:Transcript_50713/g.135178  ORF Transcript_50713/g.135178 Transcript_50713/m.135178 type:complete len:494 (+) Transcript_50713:201-1682(+)